MPDTPDQSGGPTWGSITIPDQLSVFSPGLATVGRLATDTAFSARRAQNLAAFDAYQKQNPGATPQDLSAYAQSLPGGADFITGAAPADQVMQSIAQKNQLQYSADQAKQQSDINTGYADAMKRAIETAETAEDWVKLTQQYLPPQLRAQYGTYMQGQNTQDMFRIYQQQRVMPIVDTGIKAMWDTEDNYVTAAGGNKSLGHMAWQMAQPQVEAAKQKIADEHSKNVADVGLTGAQTLEAQRRAAADAAQTALDQDKLKTEAAQRQLLGAQTADTQAAANLKADQDAAAQTAARAERKTFLDKELETNPTLQQALATQSQDLLASQKKRLYDAWKSKYNDPKLDAEFNAWWDGAAAQLSGDITASNNAKLQATVDANFQTIQSGSKGLADVFKDDKMAASQIDANAYFPNAGSGKQVELKQRTVSLIRQLLADPNMATTDPGAFVSRVAQDVAQGMSDDQIRDDVSNAPSPRVGGAKLYGPGAAIKTDMLHNTDGYGQTPTSIPQVQNEVTKMVTDAAIAVAAARNSTTGKGYAGPVAINANIQAARDKVNATRNAINSIIAKIFSPDPSMTGQYFGPKDSKTYASLMNERQRLDTAAADLARLEASLPKVAPGVTRGNGVVNIAGTNYAFNMDVSTANPAHTGEIPAKLQSVQHHPPVQGGRAMPGSAPTPIDPRFEAQVNRSPVLQQIMAATEEQLLEIQSALTQAGAQGPDYDIKNYDPAKDPLVDGTSQQAGSQPVQLDDATIGKVVQDILHTNRDRISPQFLQMVQDSMTTYFRNAQKQNKLGFSQ